MSYAVKIALRKESEGLYVVLAFLFTDFCGVCKPLTLFKHCVLPFLLQQCEQVAPTSLYLSREEIRARKTLELRKGDLEMDVGGSTLDPKLPVKKEKTICRIFLVEDQDVSKTRSLANRKVKTWKERPGLNYNRNSRNKNI